MYNYIIDSFVYICTLSYKIPVVKNSRNTIEILSNKHRQWIYTRFNL